MLKTRIITALVILPIVLIALFFFPRWGWALFSLAIMALSAWEWSRFCAFTRAAALAYLAAGAALAGVLAVQYLSARGAGFGQVAELALGAAALFWVLLVPAWLLLAWRAPSPWLTGVAGYLAIFPMWIAMLVLRDAGPWVILTFAAIVWVADIAAYFAGRKFGRHKLAPAISPGKTVEGVIGGVTAVALYFFLWQWLAGAAAGEGWIEVLRAQRSTVLALFLLLALLSVVGDLFESWMKRGAAMKDSSHLLPGHGGILDRIDALTSTLPLAALYLMAIGYPA